MCEAKVALELSKREARNLLSAISSELREGPYSLHPMDEEEYKAYVASLRSVANKLLEARARLRKRPGSKEA